MLDSLTIRNFRLFEDLTIERLGRVNLIVGKNNSGKSCLLEAIELLVSGFSPQVVFGILERRCEYQAPLTSSRPQRLAPARNSDPHPVSNLFFGRSLEHTSIRLQADAGKNRIDLRVDAAYYADNDRHRPEYLGPQPVIGAANRRFLQIHRLADGNESPRPLLPLDLDLAEAVSHLGTSGGPAIVQVSATGLSGDDIGRYWNALALQPLQRRVVAALTAVFPEILDVTVNYDPDLGEYLIRVRLADGGITTVNSLGDGVRRLFGLLLAVTAARNGFLLIDEIEIGLHWSVQQALWQSLFTFAEDLDVQVFATTHSEDTVSAFASVWSKHEHLGCFHRLERHPRTGRMVISTYALETLSASVETDFEVR